MKFPRFRTLIPKPLRSYTDRLYLKHCERTAGRRPLPDFIIIGAQKSGTTSLFDYLLQHPDIKGSFCKEVHFFTKNYERGESWYRARFPVKKTGTRKFLYGEATPYYICHPHVPKRIHQLVPDIKLIAVLRNPTDRAISHYFHVYRKKREPLPLMEALQQEEQRLQKIWSRILADESYANRDHQWYSYKQRGLYAEQLQRYFDLFERHQILIVDSADLFKHTAETIRQIHAFLGVAPQPVSNHFKARNVGTKKGDIAPEVYSYLDEYFAPHNRALSELTGRSFSWGKPLPETDNKGKSC